MPDFDPAKVKLDLEQVARWNSLALPHLVERGGLEPGGAAVVFDGATRTYGDLRDRSRRVANALVGLGIETMDRVAVLSSNRLEFLEIEVGIAGARAIMVPLNWRLRAGELANLLRRSQARAIFVEDRFLPTIAQLRRDGEIPELRTIVALDGDAGDLGYEELCDSALPERPERVGHLDDPHEIIFTSGTTGQPKGVVWSNGGLIFNAMQQVIDFRMGPDCSAYCMIDLYYIGGRHDLGWSTLYGGGTLHVKPSSNFVAEDVLRYVCEHRITHVLWVPTMLYDILAVPGVEEFDTSHLRMIMCGGQAVTEATTTRAQEVFPTTDFIQVYGLTEGGGSVTFIPPKYARSKPGSAGKPSINAEIKLVDPEGTEVPAGTDGEILVRAASMTAGYWDAPETSARLITPDGWLRTGDVGHQDDEGFLYISGRKGDMIISGGMNVFPVEVEDILSRHPAVAGVAVIGVPDEKWGELVCAVIELNPGAWVQDKEIIAYCNERLASYKKPRVVKVVEEIPRTASGKAQKFELRKRYPNAEALVGPAA